MGWAGTSNGLIFTKGEGLMADKEFTTLVGECIGAASVAWSEIPKGIFDSDRCRDLVKEIETAHQAILTKNKIYGLGRAEKQ